MTLAIVLVVIAVLALAVVLRIAVSHSLQITRRGHFSAQIEPIDIEAFRNLVSPAESEYLRRRLPAAEFRRVQRHRLQATARYVQAAARNASTLTRVGQSALASSDPQTVEAARQLVDNALLLRRNATIALIRIYFGMAWPNAELTATPLIDSYGRLSGAAMLLGRLQNPAAPVRISA
ncbi:MAG TPA: hypothetical protein VMG31_03355 [Verrucomicrobiae bacterium]|nr:hypothetical protein [Verrucomicrobiae bacterium]